MKQENLLRFVVADDTGVKTELVIERQDSGRYYLSLSDDVGGQEIELTPGLLQELRRAIELTPGLLQELRRAIGKIA